MEKIYKLFGILLLMMGALEANATHNRAGEIFVEQVGDCSTSLTVKATIVTYTKVGGGVTVDRDTLKLLWGDGMADLVPRSNGPGTPPNGELLENGVKVNRYIAYHTYSTQGQYTLSMQDPNRDFGIWNLYYPYSGQIPFYVQTVYTLTNAQFQGCNDTPRLLQPPLDVGCVGVPYTHNPNAYDPDGDSLSFQFIVPLMDRNEEVLEYTFPNQSTSAIPAVPGEDTLTIDHQTGQIYWNAPQKAGEYSLAILIVSYRNGFPLDSIIRDMQILIKDCENDPPEIELPYDEICVVAGEVVEFDVVATAPLTDESQKVKLVAQGGPFEQGDESATFLPNDTLFYEDPFVRTFRWQTTCNHIEDQYYTVVFKAEDDYFNPESGLATLKPVRIKVVGPPPEDVGAVSSSGSITVSWEKPYICEDADNFYFRGFSVWRRINSNDFEIDKCRPGLDGRGYEKVNIGLTNEMLDGRYQFVDNDVESGRTYCYRVVAQFAHSSPSGNFPYNPVDGLPSEEVCIQLARDVPLMTKVDVTATSATDGVIDVCWAKPNPMDLDTIMHQGPYRYEVLRAVGMTNDEADFVPIGVEFTTTSFGEMVDTCFTDAGLNTSEQAYSYLVNFYSAGTLIGASNTASSVFLNINPTDNELQLSWSELVPWTNTEYVVFLQNGQTGVFEPIDTVLGMNYEDKDLINGVEYCYKIEALGTYAIDGIQSPLINFSQEVCSVPVDNVAPCPPSLEVTNICDAGFNCNNVGELFNTLSWTNPIVTCEETDDVVGYNIYYKPSGNSTYEQIINIDDANLTSTEHIPPIGLAGCYYVTAVDTFANESLPSMEICVDNCPFYELPNTFTPNDDGQNDIFKPYPYCFVEKVDFVVYNQWGGVVFETSDPDINWDGKDNKGKDMSNGVYYYTCVVYEQRVEGVIARKEVLKGYIELLR